MRSLREIPISLGFVQVPLEMYKASQTRGLDLKTACECGERPKMEIHCSCGEQYSSWFGVPNRAYEYAKGQSIILTKEEMEKALEEAKSYDTIEVLKVVDFKRLAIQYCFDDTYYLLPATDSNEITRKAFRILVKALDSEGWALITKVSLRKKTYRIAIISDSEMNVLVGYRIQDKRELPFDVPTAEVSDMEYGQLRGILESSLSDDVKVEAEPEPYMALIEAKVEAVFQENVDKTVRLGVAE